MHLKIEVPAVGPRKAKIALVGQAPGAEELLDKEPFTGPAGQQLDSQLRQVGLRREDLYITNVIKRKLPGNNIKPLYEDASMTKPGPELQAWWEALEKELKEVGANVIVALGNDALLAVTGINGIGKYRGSILQSKWGSKVVPTYRPFDVIRSYSLRPLALSDLRKAKRESLHPEIILPKRDFLVAPSFNTVERYLKDTLQAGIASVDIETVKNTFISCIGFSYDPKHALCIPFLSDEGKWWSPEEYWQVQDLINQVLSSKDVKIVGQNFYYDWCWLKRAGYDIQNFWFDTLVAMHSAWPQMPKGLDVLASLFTNEPYWKDERKDINGVKDWMEYWRYNCKDAAVTLELVEPLQNELDRQHARETFDFEMSMVPHFVNQTLRGIAFDRDKRNKWRRDVRKKMAEVEDELDSLLPPGWVCQHCEGRGEVGKRKIKICPECGGKKIHVNAQSPKQLQKLIYESMGLPKTLVPKDRSTDEDAILKLEAKRPHPIFKRIIDYRGWGNLLGFLNAGVDSDARIRTTLSISTYTGRIASSGNPFGTGRNLQNVARQGGGAGKVSKSLPVRELFIADPGHILYGPDYSKAEAFVIAYESGDPIYIEALEHGDIHRKNASVIFEKPESEVTDDERQLGKRACHGLNYLMGDRTLCDYIIKEMGPEYAITQREAKRFREAYFETYKGLRDFQQRVIGQIKTTRVLKNSFGRSCQFLGRPAGATLREAVAFLPQSTVGDLCNRAILRVNDLIPDLEFLLQIHDQLLLQGDAADDQEAVASKIVEAMMIPITAVYTGITYKVPVDMKIGTDWENLH